MKKPLILVGGGGHCKSVIEAALSSGWTIKGILDLPECVGTECLGYPVIGTDADIPEYADECEFAVTLGFIKDPHVRISLHNLIRMKGGKLATIIASTAHVSRFARVGAGTVVLHNACVNAGARIGEGCIVNTLADIEHDVEIGDYSHISTGALVNGDCRIGRATFIGSGAVIANQTMIGDEITVGAGSVVCSDLMEEGIYYGVPAKKH